MNATPAVRSLRAAVFAGVCVLLAAAGHGLAMGDMPPLWADGAGFLGVFATGWLLGGRERSLPGIGAAMLATQAALHVAFDAARSPSGSQGMPAMPGMPAMSANGVRLAATHAGSLVFGHAHAVASLHGHAAAAVTDPRALTPHAAVAHVLAALVASWWLRRGEAALWSLLRWAVAFVPGLVAWWRDAPAAPYALSGRPTRASARTAPLRQLMLRHAVSRRGPPIRITYPI